MHTFVFYKRLNWVPSKVTALNQCFRQFASNWLLEEEKVAAQTQEHRDDWIRTGRLRRKAQGRSWFPQLASHVRLEHQTGVWNRLPWASEEGQLQPKSKGSSRSDDRRSVALTKGSPRCLEEGTGPHRQTHHKICPPVWMSACTANVLFPETQTVKSQFSVSITSTDVTEHSQHTKKKVCASLRSNEYIKCISFLKKTSAKSFFLTDILKGQFTQKWKQNYSGKIYLMSALSRI